MKSNKNDANDAQAICEAMGRPNMYPVKVKTVEQQDIQAMHRVREELAEIRKLIPSLLEWVDKSTI